MSRIIILGQFLKNNNAGNNSHPTSFRDLYFEVTVILFPGFPGWDLSLT